jgi:glycogen debranching enzyme
MVDEGFNNEIGVDLKTGFVFGGNIHNCDTWMDKMGSSIEAGNKGQPASPRDGSAVELIGLSYSSIRWLADMNKQGNYSYKSVSSVNGDGSKVEWTLAEWAHKIEENFEQNFYVIKGLPNERRPDLINKEHIYKDTLNSGSPWTDYQLRCNFPITMSVAPELFDPQHAWAALQIVRIKLLGPLGIATLDPDDWSYRYISTRTNYFQKFDFSAKNRILFPKLF